MCSLGQVLTSWLRQPPTGTQSEHICRRRDEAGSVRQPSRRTRSLDDVGELGGDEGCRRADHPASDIGRKAFARTAQICWEHTRQVVAPEAELANCRDTDTE